MGLNSNELTKHSRLWCGIYNSIWFCENLKYSYSFWTILCAVKLYSYCFFFFFLQFLGAIRVWTQKESALSLSQSRFSLEYFSFWVISMCSVLKIREEEEVDSYLPSSVACWPSLWRLGIITNKQLLLE